jgi:large subunit ribosomal protein L9
MRRSRELKLERDKASAEELVARLSASTVVVPAKAGAEGRLFGSVTAADLAEAIQAATGVELDRRRVHLDEPIRTVGVHQIAVRLHPEVEAQVTVEVTAQG